MAIKLIRIFCFVCVFVVWISRYKVLMQVFQGIENVQQKEIWLSVSKHFFPM